MKNIIEGKIEKNPTWPESVNPPHIMVFTLKIFNSPTAINI
jgi:hypothetical protein